MKPVHRDAVLPSSVERDQALDFVPLIPANLGADVPGRLERTVRESIPYESCDLARMSRRPVRVPKSLVPMKRSLQDCVHGDGEEIRSGMLKRDRRPLLFAGRNIDFLNLHGVLSKRPAHDLRARKTWASVA